MRCDERLLTFVKYVKEMTGLELVIAGGYCRDLIHCVRPKDVDMFLLYNNNELEVRHLLNSFCGFKFDWYGKYGRARGNPEYKGVFKGHISGMDVDIILWESPAENVEEVVSKFDLNANQYWVGDDGEIKFFDDAPHITGELKVLREDDPERVKYIQEKLGYNL